MTVVGSNTDSGQSWGFIMASPQKENGYTPTAHELVEAICSLTISGTAHRVLRYIERKTYGFHKKKDCISISQFEDMLQTDRRTITRAIDELEKNKIIFVDRCNTTNEYSINKDYETWVGGKMAKGRGQNAPRTRGQNATYKRYKDTKDISKTKVLKDMAWKQYNENKNSDDDLEVIDMDSQKPVQAKKREKKVTEEMKQVFDLFNNPAKVTWGMRELERVASQALFDTYGIEKLKIRISRIQEESKKKDPLFPLIVTPSQLLDKMPNVERYLNV